MHDGGVAAGTPVAADVGLAESCSSGCHAAGIWSEVARLTEDARRVLGRNRRHEDDRTQTRLAAEAPGSSGPSAGAPRSWPGRTSVRASSIPRAGCRLRPSSCPEPARIAEWATGAHGDRPILTPRHTAMSWREHEKPRSRAREFSRRDWRKPLQPTRLQRRHVAFQPGPTSGDRGRD
jgi:hypothetical protein